MHSLQAFYGNLALGVTDATLPAVADQTINVYNNQYQFLTNRTLLKSFAAVPNGTAVRLAAPSFNRGFQPTIDPIDAAAAVGGNLPPICDYMGYGPDIPKLENFGPLVTRAGAGAADCFVFLWTTPRFVPAPAGKAYTIRCTANAVGAVGGWRLGTITPDQNLPNGTFQCIGMRIEGANCIAGRLNFVNQFERPGVIANVDATSWLYPSFRFGYGGLFGEFINTNLPQIEIFGVAAVAVQTVYLDLLYKGQM